MFKVPFEHILSPVIFEEIEKAQERKVSQEYRIYPIGQGKLLEEGCEIPEESSEDELQKKKSKSPIRFLIKDLKCEGNKWGGKYLHAPNIFFTILEKGKGKLVSLKDVAEVKRGITTGANEFFYLDEERLREWNIEKEFLKPVIKSPRECRSILIKPEDLKFKIFMCHKDKKDLKGTNTLKYIGWGEQSRKDAEGKEIGQFHKRPTCNGRTRWWDLGNRIPAAINFNYLIDESIRFYFREIYASDNFQEIHTKHDQTLECLLLNSTLTAFFANMSGRTNFGGGLLKIQTYEVAKLSVLKPGILSKSQADKIKNLFHQFASRKTESIYTELGINPSRPVCEQTPEPLPDRKALDDIVFDILGMTEAERNEVYWAVCELVKNRLDKARSV